MKCCLSYSQRQLDTLLWKELRAFWDHTIEENKGSAQGHERPYTFLSLLIKVHYLSSREVSEKLDGVGGRWCAHTHRQVPKHLLTTPLPKLKY